MGMSLAQLDRELTAKREELAALFEAKKDGDGRLAMTEEECAEARKRNEELARLKERYELAREADEIRRQNRMSLEELKRLDRRRFAEPGEAGERQAGRPARTLGQLFVESPAFREYQGGRSPVAELDFDLKTLFQTSAGWAPETDRTGRVELFPTQPVRVADIVPQTETQQSAVVYMEETTFTNSAAEAAEGAAAGEAALAVTERTSTVRKIAVFLPVSDEQFEDEPRARDYVDNRLTFMCRQRLDQQLLTGNGTAPNLRGVLNVSGILTQAKGADPIPDAVHRAIVKVRSQGFAEPSHAVFHPNNWQTVRLLRTADGVYVWGSPADPGPEMIWGIPVVQSTYETEGTALVGDFRMFTELAVRRGVEIQVSNSNEDYFVKGKLAVRADFRVAFIVYRPKAFCTVTGI